jgi:hypothetical protein
VSAVDPEIDDETMERVIEHGTEGLFTGKRVSRGKGASGVCVCLCLSGAAGGR